MESKKAAWSWIAIDVGNSAFATTVLASVFPIYLANLLPKEGVTFDLGWFRWVAQPISIWSYSVSLSLFLVFVIAPWLGAWADRGHHRKQLFMIATLIGALSSLGLGLATDWPTVLFWFVLANVGFSASTIFYNSLLENVAHESNWHRLSLQGFAWGYVGGGVLLALQLVVILNAAKFGFESTAAATRASLITVGIWWLLFSVPGFFFIKEVGPIAHQAAKSPIRQIIQTVKELLTNRNLLLFFAAFALFNEGIQTVISMASIYGKATLQLPESTLLGTLLMIQFLGWPLTLAMQPLVRIFGPKRLLVSSIVIWLLLVIVAYRMSSSIDFWLLGAGVALVLGVSQSLPRSILSQMVPAGRKAEFFSLFAISGKMTAFLGPLTFGLVQDLSGDTRSAILSISVFFLLGLITICFVSIDRTKNITVE